MKNGFRIRLVIFTYFAAIFLNAHASRVTGQKLSENCQELIAIYNKKGDQRLFAGMSTSVSEAMRAGICLGMIEEHTNHSRCSRDWYDMAEIIAVENDSQKSAEDLLEMSCGRRR